VGWGFTIVGGTLYAFFLAEIFLGEGESRVFVHFMRTLGSMNACMKIAFIVVVPLVSLVAWFSLSPEDRKRVSKWI
jgi:hypothetical protein